MRDRRRPRAAHPSTTSSWSNDARPPGPPRPRRRGVWSSADGRVVSRAPAPRDRRPFARGEPAVPLGRRAARGHPQRRDLQLHARSARRAGGGRATSSASAPTPRSCSRRYRQWGEGLLLERLSGMFAFALWDGEAQQPPLRARPRRQEAAPLRGRRRRVRLRLGAEGARRLAGVPPRARPDRRRGLPHVRLRSPTRRRSGRASRKLPPGQLMTVSLRDGSPRVREPRPYWDFELDRGASPRDWDAEIAAALEHAADEMSFADVPVGAFLSGGIDSSSVVAALARSGREPQTYTVGFDRRGLRRAAVGAVSSRTRAARATSSASLEAADVDAALPRHDRLALRRAVQRLLVPARPTSSAARRAARSRSRCPATAATRSSAAIRSTACSRGAAPWSGR